MNERQRLDVWMILCLLQLRSWEKRLQTAAGDSADVLSSLAQEQLKLYRQHLPKPGMPQLTGPLGPHPVSTCISFILLTSRHAQYWANNGVTFLSGG